MEDHPEELFPRVGFIVTNLTLPSRALVRFYNKRGTAEVAAATRYRKCLSQYFINLNN